MNIFIMSRENAVEYCRKEHSIDSIIVSIRDVETDNCAEYKRHYYPFVGRSNGVKAILPVHFDDVDSGDTAMSREDAAEIADFLRKNLRGYDGNERIVIVHCGAGVSRSAGVAAAIMLYYNNDDSPVFDCPSYRPNMLCYRTMLNELMDAG